MRKRAGSKRYAIRRQKRSLKQVIAKELAEATIAARRRIDLSDVTGRWVHDPTFDEIVASQRQID